MSNSRTGDNLNLSVGKNPVVGSSVGVSGWFDVLHTCGATGEVTDHSGPNCILLDGVYSMLAGLSATVLANGSGVACTKAGILLTGSDTARTPGQQALPANYASLNCATSTTTDRLYPNDADTMVNISSNMSAGLGGIWFDSTSPSSTEDDIFITATDVSASPAFSIVSASIVVKANQSGASQIVDGIFVVNQITASNPGTGTTTVNSIVVPTDFRLLAGRTSAGASTGDMGTPITMNNTDTLTITYTLTVTAG